MGMIRIVRAAAALALLVPVSAQAQGICEAYARQSAELKPDFDKAFQLMQARDIAALKTMLPALQARLDKIAPAPIPTQRCGAEVRVYDAHQFATIMALRKAGKPVPGFAADANFVSTELNFGNLAYVVGWIQYELGDFEAARIAYAKGLAIAPDEHNLTKEYVAVLLNQNKFAEIVGFLDRFLASDTDLQGGERADLIAIKGLSQAATGDLAGAQAASAQVKAIDPNNQYIAMIDQAIARKQAKP
ncbi:hypothetical protein [Sphingomonas sp. dw_22]|uniref:tetratricopeptide repeat protein n=1 Tax=Sphingomonas sp. dw_22 TaxID=2721175 RepID=UPI001BD59148|nr:hypothetical protein [Sphingomonas sp. dw_22]